MKMTPSWYERRCPLAVGASGARAVVCCCTFLLMYTLILKCVHLLLKIVLRFLFSGNWKSNWFNVTLALRLQPANSVDGQLTLNLQLSLVLYFLVPQLRKRGGNLRPKELQKVQLGPGRKSAMPCEPLPAPSSPCPFPTTPGRPLKKRHGGQWWAALDSCSPPSTPEPWGEGGAQEQHKLEFQILLRLPAFTHKKSIPEASKLHS